MSRDDSMSLAQAADNLLSRTALGVLLLAVANAGSALAFFVGDDASLLLDRARLALAVVMVAIVLPPVLRFARLRRQCVAQLSECDSYLSQVFSQASVFAFSVTFVLTVALEATADKFFADLPTAFFLNVILAVSLFVLGGAFFYRIRRDASDEEV